MPSHIATVVESWLVANAPSSNWPSGASPSPTKTYPPSPPLRAGRQRRDPDPDRHGAISYTVGRWTDAEAANLDEPDLPNYLCSNHLLVATEEEAQAALERFESGEAFATSRPNCRPVPLGRAAVISAARSRASSCLSSRRPPTPVRLATSSGRSRRPSAGTSSRSRASARPPSTTTPCRSGRPCTDCPRHAEGMVNLMILDLEGTSRREPRSGR